MDSTKNRAAQGNELIEKSAFELQKRLASALNAYIIRLRAAGFYKIPIQEKEGVNGLFQL